MVGGRSNQRRAEPLVSSQAMQLYRESRIICPNLMILTAAIFIALGAVAELKRQISAPSVSDLRYRDRNGGPA